MVCINGTIFHDMHALNRPNRTARSKDMEKRANGGVMAEC